MASFIMFRIVNALLLMCFIFGFDFPERFDDSFSQVLRHTQACTNKNLQYTSLMGILSGIGSEFQAYLLKSLMYAIANNRRLVYVKTQLPWEYHCKEKSGWACYFAFDNCIDSVVNVSELVFTQLPRVHDLLTFPGTIMLDNVRPGWPLDQNEFYKKFRTLQKRFVDRGYVNETADIGTLTYSSVMSIAAKHLFILNDETKHLTKAMNVQAYPGLFIGNRHGMHKYVALQIRLQDKRAEMSKAQWDWMTNTSNIAQFTLNYLTDINHLFIATDNCSTVPAMQRLLPPTITIHSSCKTNTVNEQGIKRDASAALKLFADIQMLRHGSHFIGLFESNLVRVVHLLRYPHSLTSHALATEGSGDRNRVNANEHMDDLNYYAR
jgi:hypothetical protein